MLIDICNKNKVWKKKEMCEHNILKYIEFKKNI